MSASTGEAELRQNSHSENSATSPEHQSSPNSWTLGDRTSNDHSRAKSPHQTASEEPEGHDRSDKDSLQGSTEKSKPKDKVKAIATAEKFKGKVKAIEKEKVTSPQKKPMPNRRSSTRLQTNDNSSLSILSDDDDPSPPSSECLPDDQAAIADAAKVQILGKKRSTAVVASALNRNTLALGGHQLELVEIQRKNEEWVRGEIGELRVRVDALEVSGLGAHVDESVISDRKTRIKALEGNNHLLKDGVDWKWTLDKEFRTLKDKVEVFEGFRKLSPSQRMSWRKLWAKLDDVSTKLEAALADNDGLRARLQGCIVNAKGGQDDFKHTLRPP
ncbi:hypothetical protein C8J55DRAFT_570860 [Lentinula edodes]|uniref:Uncharacterized protein n=1 Tax=Lentinula lateritia TaxID=40482 RepID=A0A9W9AJ56_9AGAR|nr:hypothetical protein C8J55DRAFT_570860 [Lentinula edodes]